MNGKARSPRRPVAAASLVLALGASCGPVASPPPSPVPSNSCPPDSCAAYHQPYGLEPASCSAAGQCTSSSNPFEVTLVVSLPETAPQNPGMTIAIPDFLKGALSPQNPCGSSSCAVVPSAIQTLGAFQVSKSVEGCAGRPKDANGASLPVDVQLWPLWPSNTTSTSFVPALSVGLPLLPVRGHTSLATGLSGVLPGPSGTPGTEWTTLAGPGAYEEDVVPLDPAYPPQRLTGILTGANQGSPIESLDQCPAPTAVASPNPFTVTRGSGSLAGFSVYFRDSRTFRRVSSIQSLPDAPSASVLVLTTGELPSAKPGVFELVVAPPAGKPIPTYVDPIQTQQLTLAAFPALPAPVTVQGTVVDAEGNPIEADLVIDSTPPSPSDATGGIKICANPDCSSTESGSTPRPLSYSTTAHAGQESGYSVLLPPGTYDVFVIPAVGVAAGATSTSLGVQAELPVAGAKTLKAAALGTIDGNVRLADGRALVGAVVEAHAAASLAATIDASIDPAIELSLDRRRWPRTASTITDARGSFSLSVDPGTYDLVVRPQEGTGFPWVTLTSRSVAAGGTLSFSGSASSIVVPAPVFVDMSLKVIDVQTPLIGAVVRAYAASSVATPPPSGAPPPQIEVGAWLTDANGHFSMFLAPPQ